jgi:Spy/CpxP family protein refolding chaperone
MRGGETALAGNPAERKEPFMTGTSDKPTRCHRRGRLFLGIFAVAVLATAGLAWAGTRAASSWCEGSGGHFGPRFARLHVDFAVDRALRAAQASPQQREQVEAIVDRAFADHAKFREQHRDLHTEAVAVLTAPTVDRARLEALRAKHMAIAEDGSRHLTAVLAEIADVLTPEQRQRLAAHAQQMFE